jgi:hypothetical protein
VLGFVSFGCLSFVVLILGTYAAEEVADEDHHRSSFGVIELFERDGFTALVEDFQLAGFLERLLVGLGAAAAFARLCHGAGSDDLGGLNAASVCFPGRCCVIDTAGVAGERTKRRGDDLERSNDRLELK